MPPNEQTWDLEERGEAGLLQHMSSDDQDDEKLATTATSSPEFEGGEVVDEGDAASAAARKSFIESDGSLKSEIKAVEREKGGFFF